MSQLNLRSKRTWLALALIAIIAATLITAFAWTAGWIGQRKTTENLVTEAVQPFPAGFRRAHGKGICYVGNFRPNKDIMSLSTARVFSQPNIPIVGRFSIGTGDPHAVDSSTKTISMALLLTTDDKQQWRMAMNNVPYFPTHNPEGFLAMRKATAPDPATGKPDPERVARFLQEYPEAEKFLKMSAAATPPDSFASATFYSVNAFLLVAEDGKKQPIRWMMQPHDAQLPLAETKQQQPTDNFLFDDLRHTLEEQPLMWDLVLQLAQPNDPINDPSQPWPQDRQQIIAGTLQVTSVMDQAKGACRDINFDPSIVPAGIEVSDDPILSARSGAYSHSFNRREREIGYGKATDAVGKQEAK